METRHLLATAALGLGMTLALMASLAQSSTPVGAASASTTLFVATTGSDGANTCANQATPCRTPQHAVDVASPGDLIKIAAGTYTDTHPRSAPVGYDGPSVITQVVDIRKPLTIQGGYSSDDWNTPNPAANPSVLDAGGTGRVVVIAHCTSVTLRGLHVTGGDATGLGGYRFAAWLDAGGGIWIYYVDDLKVSINTVFGNEAALGGGVYLDNTPSAELNDNAIHMNTASAGAGGGIYSVSSLDPTFTNNHIFSNEAATHGGGIYNSYNHRATMVGNYVHSNIASQGGGIYTSNTSDDVWYLSNAIHDNEADRGGGMFLAGENAALVGNQIYSNTATGEYADAGGIYISGSGSELTDNEIIGNTAEEHAGGIYVSSTRVRVALNSIYSNTAGDQGGGILAYNADSLTVEDNTLHSNAARLGGGAYVFSSDNGALKGNYFHHNISFRGAAVYFYHSNGILLSNNRLYTNEADNIAGGLYLLGGGDVTIRGNDVRDNIATQGAGILVRKSARATISANDVHGNSAHLTAGGIGIGDSSNDTILESNRIYRNTASATGGGIRIWDTANVSLINNIVVENRVGADGVGCGVYLERTSSGALSHNTIARNAGGEGSGIRVAASVGGGPSIVTLTNNILVSHTVGITVGPISTATIDATLWGTDEWENQNDWGGDGTIFSGPHNYWGHPDFVGPHVVDYHIGPGSAAIDGAVQTGLMTDRDGVPRPQGAASDIGAYEFHEFALIVDKTGTGAGTVTKEPNRPVYYYGDTVTLTATAEPYSVFAGWTGSITTTTNPLSLTIQGDTRMTATFTQDEYTLDVVIVGEGTVSKEPHQETYHYGDVVTLTPAADPGWSFAAWSGPDAADLSDNSDGSWDLVMDSDKSVTATFAQDEYTLDVSIVGEGDVSFDPERATYHYGDVVTLTATADPGWTFHSWSGDIEGAEEVITHIIVGDTQATVTFTQDEYSLDVTIVGEGDVDADPYQDTYHYSDVITLTATPDVGWTFVGWTGDVDSTKNPLALTIEGDTVITATFTQDEYTLDVAIVGEGEVDIAPEQDTYVYGDTVTLTATADPGWTFAAWSGDVESPDNPLDFVVEGDTVITATFTEEYKKIYLPLVLANQ